MSQRRQGEIYRAVMTAVRAITGRPQEVIIFKETSDKGYPKVKVALDTTMKNTIELDTAMIMELIEHLIAAELASEDDN